MVPEIKGATEWVLGHFLPFDPPNNAKNRNFEKMKKKPGDIIIFTFMYQKYWSYDLWFLRYGAQQTEFFVILGHFCPLTPLTIWKIKNLKIWKTPGISVFYICVPQMTIIWCIVPEIWSKIDRIFCHFGPFFLPFYLPH